MRTTTMRTGMGLVLGVLLTLGVVGCGAGGGGDQVANPKASKTAQLSEQDRMLKFTQCMREHGVNIPDPKGEGGGFDLNVPEGTDPNKVQEAMQQCKPYAPNGGEPPKLDPQMAELNRQYAKCMREHGLPNFPDPGPDGGIQLNGNDPAMNPNDPKFQAAQKACAQPGRPTQSPGLDSRGN